LPACHAGVIVPDDRRAHGREAGILPAAARREDAPMHFGGVMFFTDYSMTAQDLARTLEERGFESVWAAEHSHIPLSRRTPYPGGGELPKPYYDGMDPFVALTAAACATSTLKLGTGVCLVQQRDAIQTAKLVASIDQVSRGRFLFGIGGGWNQDEMENHGTVYKTRFKRVRESVEAMKAIWTRSKAEYHGEFVNFDPMMAWPKPVQKPYPPIHVGGAFPHGARRAIRYGDGWIPVRLFGDASEMLPDFHRMMQEAGRDPASMEITLMGPSSDPDRLKRLADMGVTRAVAMLPSDTRDKTMVAIDRWTKTMRAVNG
jgi:probable F420-dependent oxidoreductase